ncbi:MAG: hypothetical protein GX291_07590 [Tissierellia bacterium]|jgi:hypothetical protein|nr:hypothetical protein [Bacillota bacterium]NLK59112.1 hypothetical protein [Tissierellia bacterium]
MIHSILLLIGIAVFVTGIVIAFGGNPISALSHVFSYTQEEKEKKKSGQNPAPDRKQSLVFLTIGGALILFGLAGVMKNESYYPYSTLLAIAACMILLFSRVKQEASKRKQSR